MNNETFIIYVRCLLFNVPRSIVIYAFHQNNMAFCQWVSGSIAISIIILVNMKCLPQEYNILQLYVPHLMVSLYESIDIKIFMILNQGLWKPSLGALYVHIIFVVIKLVIVKNQFSFQIA